MKRSNKKILSLVLTIAMLLMSMSSLTVFAEVDTFNASMVTYDGVQFWIDFPSSYTVDSAEYSAESVTVKKVNGGTEIPVTGVSIKENNKGMNVHDLFLAEIILGQGPTRVNKVYFRGRAHGADRIVTRTSHIKVVLDVKE